MGGVEVEEEAGVAHHPHHKHHQVQQQAGVDKFTISTAKKDGHKYVFIHQSALGTNKSF